MSCDIVDDCLLAGVSSAIGSLLTDVCTIKRVVLADDGRGGRTRTLTDLATGVACTVQQARYQASELPDGDKMTGKTQWSIFLPAGQDVKAATDQIVVTSLGNRTFEVIGMLSASLEVVRMVQATEVDPV